MKRPALPSPLRVGVTGGIASGKSTVSAALTGRGYPLLDADEVYHRLVAEDREMRAELAEAFGPAVFGPDGQLDRKALGTRVFADPAARRRLGEITHPRVRREMGAWMEREAGREERAPGLFVVIPLLFENGLDALFDRTVLVSAPEEEQLRRLVRDRGLTMEEAKRHLGRHELANDGPRESLEARVESLLDALGLPRVYPPASA